MRALIHCVSLVFLLVTATIGNAQVLKTNSGLIVLTNRPARKLPLGVIATNTPAFENYGLPLILGEVNRYRTNWHLDIPQPLTTNNLYITLKANWGGVDGAACTRDGRFRWNFRGNHAETFADTNYFPQSFRYIDDASARLTKLPSKINAHEAELIARKSLHQLGLTEKQLELIEPPDVNQYKFEETDGTVYPLPIFHVAWQSPQSAAMSQENRFYDVEFDISGITKMPVEYVNMGLKTPRSPRPTNFFEMLGVKPPSNRMQRLGFEPLDPITEGTNSAAK